MSDRALFESVLEMLDRSLRERAEHFIATAHDNPGGPLPSFTLAFTLQNVADTVKTVREQFGSITSDEP